MLRFRFSLPNVQPRTEEFQREIPESCPPGLLQEFQIRPSRRKVNETHAECAPSSGAAAVRCREAHQLPQSHLRAARLCARGRAHSEYVPLVHRGERKGILKQPCARAWQTLLTFFPGWLLIVSRIKAALSRSGSHPPTIPGQKNISQVSSKRSPVRSAYRSIRGGMLTGPF